MQIKKNYKISIGIVIILLIAGYTYYTFPIRVSLNYNGIKYRIGDFKQQEQTQITVNGYYYNRLFAKDYFEGSISVDNESYPNDSSYPRLKLLVGEEFQTISYRDFKNGGINTYGEIFIGEKFKSLTICVHDGKNGWSSKDGFMISAPAKNRDEALEISNQLMGSVLKEKLQ